jgi:hypothetical protein
MSQNVGLHLNKPELKLKIFKHGAEIENLEANQMVLLTE